MIKSTFKVTIFLSFILIGCNNEKDTSKREKEVGSELVVSKKDKRVNITFDKKVNGYDVSIVWSPFKEIKNTIIGPAVLQFNKPDQKKSIEIITDYFSIPSNLIEISNNQYKLIDDVKPNKIKINYKEFNLKNDKTIGQIEMPFFFFDIDFDGSKELLITEHGREKDFVTKYKVFKIEDGILANPKNQITDLDPYNNIYTDTEIDIILKKIINK
tara:strand:- start:1338 stop:1979 length:642 start_codon:yes stop_codon:yes gene_type:complete